MLELRFLNLGALPDLVGPLFPSFGLASDAQHRAPSLPWRSQILVLALSDHGFGVMDPLQTLLTTPWSVPTTPWTTLLVPDMSVHPSLAVLRLHSMLQIIYHFFGTFGRFHHFLAIFPDIERGSDLELLRVCRSFSDAHWNCPCHPTNQDMQTLLCRFPISSSCDLGS